MTNSEITALLEKCEKELLDRTDNESKMALNAVQMAMQLLKREPSDE